MTGWYHYFIAAVFLLWAVSTPRDRNALRIVLIASLVSEVIVDEITSQISGAWKLVIPGAVEILTILALLKWARNRTGYLQAALLVIAWGAHFQCYLDIVENTDLVYSRYESIIFWVAVGQLIACYDTLQFNFGRAMDTTTIVWSDCILAFRNARGDAGLSLVATGEKSENVKGKCDAIQKPAVMSQ